MTGHKLTICKSMGIFLKFLINQYSNMYFEVTIAKAKKNLVLYLTLYSLLNLKGTEKLPLMSCTCADPSPQGILFKVS